MDAEPRLLPYHPRPLRDESLPSYLFRLAGGNGYDPISLLMIWLHHIVPTSPGKSFRHMEPHFLLPSLHSLTSQPIEMLYETMYHRFAPTLELPGKEIAYCQIEMDHTLAYFAGARGRSLFVRNPNQYCFCPLCLQETTYHRLPWMLKILVVCPEHHCYLIEHCQCCEARLSLSSVMQGHCDSCGFDLRNSRLLCLNDDDLILQAQRCIHSWLMGQAAPENLNLPDAPERILFRILDGLRTIANLAGPGWAGYHVTEHDSPNELYASVVAKGCTWASALQGLMNWPDGFFSFLEQYRFRPHPFRLNSLQALNVLYSTWIQVHWQHPGFDFLQQAFNQYLVNHFPPTRSLRRCARLQKYPELNNQFAYIDIRNAARLLNSSPPAIKTMIRDGLLDVYPERDGNRPGVFLYRSQIEAAVRRQHEGFSRKMAAQKLGLNLPVVDKLLNAGLLHQTGSSSYARNPICLFQDEDIAAFQTRLATVVRIEPEATDGRIRLVQAVEQNGKIALGIPQLIQRVLDEKITAYHAHPQLFPLNDLCFDPIDIVGLVQQVKKENDWISFLEVVDVLGISRRTLHYWMEHSILVPHASFARAQYFSKSEVLQWQQRLLTSIDVAHMLCVATGGISAWVRTGYLEPVSNVGKYLFDREYIEEWLQRYITLGELMCLLNVDSSMVRQWRAVGLLTPVNGAHTHPWFYHRREVMQLQQQHA